MLITILLIAVALLAVLAVVVATRPARFAITRSAAIPAPPAAVFALVNDFHRWDAWSPWAKLDPACQNTFDGPAAGVGAKFAWAGNNKVGAGRMTITSSRLVELIHIDLEFFRPMKARNLTEFIFVPKAGGTRVTWTMSGGNGFAGKLFSVFVNCDKMVGGQFEQGLANLKSLATPAI